MKKLRITKSLDTKDINLIDIQHDLKCYEARIQKKMEWEKNINCLEELKKVGIDITEEEAKSTEDSMKQESLDLIKSLKTSKMYIEKILIDQDKENSVFLELEELYIKMVVAHFNYLQSALKSECYATKES